MKKVYKSCIAVTLLFMLVFNLNAQERSISGTVKDSGGEGIPGVNVLVKGTSNGTTSDSDGKYTLSVGDGAILVFSFIGFQTQEVTVGAQSVVDVTLAEDIQQLTEVIVTGYSIDSRRETTGSVSIVKAKDLTIVPSGNVEQQLQGRVPGVTVVSNGQPGTTSQIRVRGFGAFGGNEPLYIVDGLPVGSVDFLAPDDIENTTVLKDAAAASIYGARAANGVIIYTTKKGSRGAKKLSVSYEGMYGVTNAGQGQDMMNPQDFANWTWYSRVNTATANGTAPTFNHPQFGTGTTPVIPDYLLVGTATGVTGSVNLATEANNYNVTNFNLPIYQVVKANKKGTDWYDAITRNAGLIRNNIGISGGGESSRYYIGLNTQEQEGILIHQKFSRYSFRANTEFDITKKLRIGENLQFTYRKVTLLQGGAGGSGVSDDENDILQAFRMPSIIPIYDEFGGYAGTRAAGFNNPRNPVANLNRQSDNGGFTGGAFGNIYLELEPIKGLVARSSVGGNYGASYFQAYFGRQYENSENNSAVTYNEGGAYSFAWTFTNTLSYKKQFGLHNLDVLLGQEALNTGKGRNINGTGLNPFSEDRDYITLNTAVQSRVVGSNYFKGVNFSSLFARLNYAYNTKYLASVVVRRDGSSRFGSENRYGVFPAFSLGWRVTSEGFMSGLTWANDIKIRGGWGIMGNSNNVNPNNQYSLYASSVGASSYPINNSGAAEGFYQSRIGNPQARWEKAVTSNIGLDGSLLGGKLDVIIDFWKKDTEDLIFQVPITVVNGPFATPPDVNVGKMVNKGIDIQLINRGNVTPDLAYEVTLNGGVLKNEIVALNGTATYLATADADPSFRGIRPIRNQLGYSISSFYGYKVEGLFQSASEATASGQAGAGVGRFDFKDVNGDGQITTDDRTYLGSPVPKFTGGLNFKFTYKGIELQSYSFLSVGNKIWNQSKWFTDFYPSFAGAGISERIGDSWSTSNTGADIPIFENVSNFSTNTQACSFYVEDGSYFRMQNISLAYNVPATMISKLKLERLKVYAGLNNVFTISKYEGLDPSVGGDVDTRFGIDVGNYPITRSLTFGLSLGF